MTRSFVVAGAALLICGGAQAQSHFTFTEQLGDSGPLMTGTFDGMLSGDVITSLSNISVFMDGVAFQGNGSLIAMHYDQDQYLYVLGGAIASLDGQHNNFLFADVDPNLGGTTNHYESLFDAQGGWDTSYAQRGISNPVWGYGPVRFRAVELAVPEPASWMLMVGGFALAGTGLRYRRRTVHFA